MIWTIFAFALALGVGAGAAVLSIISSYRLNAAERDLRDGLRQLSQLGQGNPNKLRAELDDLRAALDVIRASNRREFGSLWGRLGGRGRQASIIDGDTGLPLSGDDEVDAMLALQSAKPVSPNGGS